MTPRLLVVHADGPGQRRLSYQQSWPRALRESRRFRCDLLDVGGRWRLPRLRRSRWDAIVVLHSVFSNACLLPEELAAWIARTRQPTVWFVGNEYKLMPEKMRFAERLGVALLISQIESERVRALYRERLGCAVASLPNTGLDPALFAARTPWEGRPVDVGYRAYEGPLYLGHVERRSIADAFVEAAPRHGVTLDVSLDPDRRFTEVEWAAFLDSCRAQLGWEAGTDYFELDDRTRLAVNAFAEEHPEATFAEVHERFFAGYRDPVSGRTISGRVIEAAGTKTLQLLLEGGYGGYFRPGEHYVSIRKDYANVDEALALLDDREACLRIVEAAHAVAQDELTYDRLLERFRALLERLP